MSALNTQVDGGHYKDLTIQPIEYIHANGIPFTEGCVIKYVTRWRTKGGIKDLEKARHFIDLLIELEGRTPVSAAESRTTSPGVPEDTVDFRSMLKESIERAIKRKIAEPDLFSSPDDKHPG